MIILRHTHTSSFSSNNLSPLLQFLSSVLHTLKLWGVADMEVLAKEGVVIGLPLCDTGRVNLGKLYPIDIGIGL